MRGRSRLLVIVLAASVASCQIRPTFTTGYTVQRAMQPPQPMAGRLAVVRFADARPPRLYTKAARAFLTYVPLLPFVTLAYERNDENVNLLSEDIKQYGSYGDLPLAPPFDTYTYPLSFPRAIADDLAASGLFGSVEYVGDGETAGYDYVLSGQVRASPLFNSATSFGLGMAGVLLWILPVPMQKTSAEVSVDVTLEDRRSGRVIWRDTLKSELSRMATMYGSVIDYGSSFGFSLNFLPLQPSVTTVDRDSLFSWHFEALRRGMEAVKPSLAQALSTQ